MKKIVVFGSINTDLVIETNRIPQNGETYKGNNFYTSHGGKGANQAVSAARLGGDVDFIGCVGNDVFGQESYKNLKDHGINTEYIQVLPNIPSGIAVIISMNQDNRILINGGANDHLKASQFKHYLRHNNHKGIFVTQLENNPLEVFTALKLAKQNGYATIFNPAPAEKLNHDVYASVDYLVINQTEAEILTGIYPKDEQEAKIVYEYFHSFGLDTLVLTLGKKGSIIFHQDDIIHIDAISVNTVDTTGAGDSYIGAFAFGLANGYTIYDCANLASKVAALAVTKAGAQTAMPTLQEVNKFN